MEIRKPFYKKFIGDRAFYSMALTIAVPIMVQNGFTTFVNLLDNIMVGRVGTDQMSGVAIANQLVFVFNLCIFGGLSGIGIFAAQFYGRGDMQGVRRTTQIKIILAFILAVLAGVIFTLWGEPLISLFLHEGSESGDLQATLGYGMEYLGLMRWLLIPFAFVQVYSSTLRETGRTIPPMVAGVIAVLVNLCFNWLLIYGNCGFPKLGVAGAAIATILSRIVEFCIVAIWTHRHKEENPFAVGLWRFEPIPGSLIREIAVKGMPLLINEALWSGGTTMLNQCYSTRGLAVVAATNISSVINQLFSIVFMALGNALGIIVGNLLGADRMQEARDTDTKMIAFSISSCVLMGTLMFIFAPLFPKLYNTTDEVRSLAEKLILIIAVAMPFHACTHACYFTLRSGGKTVITFLYDSVYLWVVEVLAALLLTRLTTLPIIPVFIIVTALECAKVILGLWMVKSDMWMHNIVKER